jgi:hypothetical protein
MLPLKRVAQLWLPLCHLVQSVSIHPHPSLKFADFVEDELYQFRGLSPGLC